MTTPATRDVTDVAPVRGADVIPGDRLYTDHGWSRPITHFVTPPAGSFAATFFGEGVRIPFADDQPIFWPIASGATVAIKARRDA
ncbi:hypothetical protein ACFHW2_12250 [Actinomadura sp. LOL_016]|uniref:hypothetical protein n=1 Tax=unclassified Actinomadura TaxID=2626254 RepID=UPI003A8088A6